MERVYPEKFEVLTKGDPQTNGGTPIAGFGLQQPLPENVIAASDEMRELVSVVRAIAPTQITVLLIGESGTGKEVFARLIHDLSPRRNGPFITVNCGAIPEGLIESELFGHERGAFTGAVGQRKGFFEAASGGTIFLDEIGEMPLQLQVKLLRVLETGSITRVGSTGQVLTDARVIAATNRDLEIDVRAGKFRSDLYYRLRAVMLRIPPLRNRRDDIPFLIEVMLEEFVKKHTLEQMPMIEQDAIHSLIENEWRGNIRELRNTLEQLVILSCAPSRTEQRCVITATDVFKALSSDGVWQNANQADRNLPIVPLQAKAQQEQTERELIYRALIELRNDITEIKELLRKNGSGPSPALALPQASSFKQSDPSTNVQSLDEIERQALRSTLERFHGNRRLAAEALGVSERTLYRNMKEQGLEGFGHV